MQLTYNDYKKRLKEVCGRYSSKTAVTYMRNTGENDILSYSDMYSFIMDSAQKFESIGFTRGDRVALLSPHSPYLVLMGMALTYYGCTIVLVDASLPQQEIEKILEFSDVKALFTVEKIYKNFSEHIISNIPCFDLDWKHKLQPFDPDNKNYIKLNPCSNTDEDVIAILYSSGTTGEMKGVMVTYESVIKAREVFERLSGLKDYMSYMLVLPFNHIAGFTGAMTYFLTGCELGFIEDVNATKLQSGLLKFQPYYFAMVPKVYDVMKQKIQASIHEKGKIAEVLMNTLFAISKFFRKYLGINIGRKMFKNITSQVFGENIYGIGTGASPCKPETTEFFLNLGLEWANLYATTETSVPITATGIHDKYPVGTVGNINHNPEISIMINNPDEKGIGEICVKSELMMKGYFKRPDLTEKAFENGYFKTGDYGYVDKKGYLYITGRIKESIVLQNGKKVSPSDVDEYYMTFITDCEFASRGIVNEKSQCDEIHMFVADKEYDINTKNNIGKGFFDISKTAPSMYKISKVHFIDKIPYTSVGKVKRFCLTDTSDEFVTNEKGKNANININDYIKILKKHCKHKFDISENDLIDELGFDSLTMYEIICEIENKYNISIADNIEHIITVADLYNFILSNNNIETYPKPKSKKSIQRLKMWIKLSKKLYKFNITGIENIPKESGYIICSNHESYFDPIWILAAMGDHIDINTVCCMSAKHTMEGATSFKFFEALGGIPVDREKGMLLAMNNARRCLNNGMNLIIFPEGARSRDGTMLPFKNGAARLAIDTRKKILPIEIDGSFEIFPRTIKYPRLFDWKRHKKYAIQIKFGTPIEPENKSDEILTKEIRQQIVNIKNEMENIRL